ncbi:membrane protein [Microbacterium phage Zooman]|nr:membrane protein [Microbacterium phage Zooman]
MMDKPKFFREERRNGILALIIGDRVAIPMWFVALFGVFGFFTVTGLAFYSMSVGDPAYAVPAMVVAGVCVLVLVLRLLVWVVKQFIQVNRKYLPSERD